MALKTIEEFILVDYACLFDLRLSAMYELFSENPELELETDKYLERRSDFLKEFYKGTSDEDQKTFDALLKEMDISILRKRPPVPTPCVNTVKLLLDEVASKETIHPVAQHIYIDVNVYPLAFTDKEKEELAAALSLLWANAEDIRIVSLSPGQVTPGLLKKYKQFIVYNFDEWISANKDELHKNPLPSLSLSSPFRSVKYLDYNNIDVASIVDDAKKQMAAFISLSLIKLREFSADVDLISYIHEMGSSSDDDKGSNLEKEKKDETQEDVNTDEPDSLFSDEIGFF